MYIEKYQKWKLGNNLRVRVPDDPSTMIALRILSERRSVLGN